MITTENAETQRKSKKARDEPAPVKDETILSSAAEAGRLHLLARGVGGRADTLHLEFEVVWLAGVLESGLISNEALGVKIVERLIEGLHAILRDAGGKGFVDLPRFFRSDDALADVVGRDQHFDGRHASGAISFTDEALRDDSFQNRRQL